MPETFHMNIEDIFFFRDGRTCFAGRIEEGEKATVLPGEATILVDGKRFSTITIEPEMIASRAQPMERLETRSISTQDDTGLTKEIVQSKQCKLEGQMRYTGHRHLIGIDSPPPEYVADDMTLGPRLPEGWDGDAWMKPKDRGYFLRAWNKTAGSYAVACAEKYEDARQVLLDEIAKGGKPVVLPSTVA